MSTADAQPTPPAALPPPAPLPLLESSARMLLAGLTWGGIQLVLFALWIRYKLRADDNPTVAWIVFVLGAVSLGLAAWHAFTLWFQKTTPEMKQAGLAAQRRTTGLALLAGGALVLLIALFLGLMQQVDLVGEEHAGAVTT